MPTDVALLPVVIYRVTFVVVLFIALSCQTNRQATTTTTTITITTTTMRTV